MTDLPEGWEWVAVNDMGEWRGGGTPSKAKPEYWLGDIPWVSAKDMKVFRLHDTQDHITPDAVAGSSTTVVPAGTVLLVTRSGILKHTLPVGVAQVPMAINQDLKALSVRSGILPEYIAWAFRAFSRLILHGYTKSGTTVQSVEFGRFKNFHAPVAPIEQQRRIVEAIEEQFSRVDAANASVLEAKGRTRLLRASIYQLAATGGLVGGRAQWDADSGLPSEWRPGTVGELAATAEQAVLTGPFGTSLTRRDFVNEGIPVLTIGSLTDGGIDLSKADHVSSRKADELKRYRVREGDVLFSRMATVGRAGLVTRQAEGSLINYHLMRLRLDPTRILPEFFVIYVKGSPRVKRYIREINHGATRDGINTKGLLAMPVTTPPLEEQREVVDRVTLSMSLVESLDSIADQVLARGARLRAAILRDAFSGRLSDIDGRTD